MSEPSLQPIVYRPKNNPEISAEATPTKSKLCIPPVITPVTNTHPMNATNIARIFISVMRSLNRNRDITRT